MIKLISFYLPQFHEIEENNEAWGKGFTEWTNVRKSKPFFPGHDQPRIPYNNNYYDLLDGETMKWQAKLAGKAGLYGFCFYHYWFKGRMVLEKPVKNLLDTKDIIINFCFSWANESWTKTWHGAGGEREILLAQKYGGMDEWKAHYDYFKDFFGDTRYIKQGGKPILLIYKIRNIPEFNQMFQYWDSLARKDGFPGICILSMNGGRDFVDKSIWVNGTVDFEPNRTKTEMHRLQRGGFPSERKCLRNIWELNSIDYDSINMAMLKKEHGNNEYRTVFVDYDDTPRRGYRGIYTRGASPKKFSQYLKKTMELAEKEGNEFLFINAWNEWGESNYLEPDTRHGYAYLNEIRKITREKQ